MKQSDSRKSEDEEVGAPPQKSQTLPSPGWSKVHAAKKANHPKQKMDNEVKELQKSSKKQGISLDQAFHDKAFEKTLKDIAINAFNKQAQRDSDGEVDLSDVAGITYDATGDVVHETQEMGQKKMEDYRKLKDFTDAAEPRYPIMIFPGMCSSSLAVEKSPTPGWEPKNGEKKRLWLSLSKLGFSIFSLGGARNSLSNVFDNTFGGWFSKDDEEKAMNDLVDEEEQMKNNWVKHMGLILDPNDGVTWKEQPDIEVRVCSKKASGLDAVDYLNPGILTGELSYVFGPTIDLLINEVGYIEGFNLEAAPFDFRLPPKMLEERDGYFSKTQRRLENMYKKNDGTRVVLLAHSMGCRIVQYFLYWVEKKSGREWIDKHVELFFMLGGPLLGSPKTLRGMISGDKMGLEAFLNDEQALKLCRGIGSIPWLFPGGPRAFLRASNEIATRDSKEPLDESDSRPFGVLNIRTDFAKSHFLSVRPQKFFELSNAAYLWPAMEANFSEEVIPDEALGKAPPVGRLLHMYGFGLKTEACFFYKRSKQGLSLITDVKLSDMGLGPGEVFPGLYCRNGICYQTEALESKVPENEREEPEDCAESCLSLHHCGHAGDGTVPYHSLAYSKSWTGCNGIKENRSIEIRDAEHRAILRDPRFHLALLQETCVRAAFTGHENEDALRLGYLDVKVIEALAPFDDGQQHELTVEIRLGRQRWRTPAHLIDENGLAVWATTGLIMPTSERHTLKGENGMIKDSSKEKDEEEEEVFSTTLQAFDLSQQLYVMLLEKKLPAAAGTSSKTLPQKSSTSKSTKACCCRRRNKFRSSKTSKVDVVENAGKHEKKRRRLPLAGFDAIALNMLIERKVNVSWRRTLDMMTPGTNDSPESGTWTTKHKVTLEFTWRSQKEQEGSPLRTSANVTQPDGKPPDVTIVDIGHNEQATGC